MATNDLVPRVVVCRSPGRLGNACNRTTYAALCWFLLLNDVADVWPATGIHIPVAFHGLRLCCAACLLMVSAGLNKRATAVILCMEIVH